jgi:hypothetical protein
VVDDVHEQPEKAIDQVLPASRLTRDAAVQQFAMTFGQCHN